MAEKRIISKSRVMDVRRQLEVVVAFVVYPCFTVFAWATVWWIVLVNLLGDGDTEESLSLWPIVRRWIVSGLAIILGIVAIYAVEMARYKLAHGSSVTWANVGSLFLVGAYSGGLLLLARAIALAFLWYVGRSRHGPRDNLDGNRKSQIADRE